MLIHDAFSLTPSLWLTVIFAMALVLQLLTQVWLLSRQVRHVAQHRHSVPPAFAHHITLAAHQKAADYTLAKARLGLAHMAYSATVLLGWTLLGGLDALHAALLAMMQPGIAQQLALLAAFALITGLLELPFSLYQTFVLEQRFGFNKNTLALWLGDLLKSTLLATVIGLPIAWAVLWLMGTLGNGWWLWAWIFWSGLQLLLMWIFPSLIAPMFNKFEPLEDGPLKTRVIALMQRSGFAAKGLFVMDGSRRSAHANAYFTGLGRAKRVVFYDTLLSKLDPDEVEAVLAHELGHFKHRHIIKRMAMMLVLNLGGFALLGWLSQQTWFFSGLGVTPSVFLAFGQSSQMDGVALLLLMLILPVFTFFISPLTTYLSRRDEFEADTYASTHANGQALASALFKLYEDNASTLTPDPIYAGFYYSHPPAVQRLARLVVRAPTDTAR